MANTTKPTVNLSGVDGNAFSVIGVCTRAGRKAGWTPTQLEAFREEATSGNYDHVLQTAMKHCNIVFSDESHD